MTYQEKIDYLFSLKGETIKSTDIFKLFNKRQIVNPDGSISLEPPLFNTYDEITVKKGQLRNVKEDTLTTVGRYIFNLVVIEYAFGDKWPFVNETIKSDQYDDLQQNLSDALLMGVITGEEFAEFQNRVVWLNNFVEIFVAGMSMNLLVLPQEIRNELQRLIEENSEAIINDDITTYLNNVEKPILKFAKKWYIDHNEPGWMIYAKGGKPKFDNVFKSMFLEVGPILDIATGRYKISTASFADGIPPEEQYLYANQNILGAYNRAVNTAVGGAKGKEMNFAMQSLKITEEDCGSQETVGLDVTKDNAYLIKWCWIKGNEEEPWILVVPGDLNKYIGKHVEYRSPLFCKSDNLCFRCCGDLYKRIGLTHIGLAATKLTSIFMNKSLKAMHDTSKKVATIDWQNYIYKINK